MDPDCRGLSVMGTPAWWHLHATKMQPEKQDPVDQAHRILRISGSAAFLSISYQQPDEDNEECWLVQWKVYHSAWEFAEGRRFFSRARMLAAFGLGPAEVDNEHSLFRLNDAESAHQGDYIRRGKCLNIPCPGTGNDGDPNISIELSDEVKKAVLALLS